MQVIVFLFFYLKIMDRLVLLGVGVIFIGQDFWNRVEEKKEGTQGSGALVPEEANRPSWVSEKIKSHLLLHIRVLDFNNAGNINKNGGKLLHSLFFVI